MRWRTDTQHDPSLLRIRGVYITPYILSNKLFSFALVGVDTSVANTLHLVVAKRVRQTADSMKVDSTDTASVSRKVRRARRVVRNHSALRTRGAGHCAAASKAVSCVSTVYCLVLLCTAV